MYLSICKFKIFLEMFKFTYLIWIQKVFSILSLVTGKPRLLGVWDTKARVIKKSHFEDLFTFDFKMLTVTPRSVN